MHGWLDGTPAHWRQCLSDGLANASASWIPRPTNFGVKPPSHYFACDQHPSYHAIQPSPLASLTVSTILSRMRGRKLIFLGESTMLQGYLAAACFLRADVSSTRNSIVSEEEANRRFNNPLHFGCLALPPSPPHAAPGQTEQPWSVSRVKDRRALRQPTNHSAAASDVSAARSSTAALSSAATAGSAGGQLCFVSLSVGPKPKSARRVGSGLADAYRLLVRRGWLRREDVLIASAGMRWNDQKEVSAATLVHLLSSYSRSRGAHDAERGEYCCCGHSLQSCAGCCC